MHATTQHRRIAMAPGRNRFNFDYSDLTSQTASYLIGTARIIHALRNRPASYVVPIGKLLLPIETLGGGNLLTPWWTYEFNTWARDAYRYIFGYEVYTSSPIKLSGQIDEEMHRTLRAQLRRARHRTLVVVELSSTGGDHEVAR